MIVLDASALVDALLDTPPHAGPILSLLREHDGDVHVPHLVDAEVGSVLRRFVLARELSRERSGVAVARLRELALVRYPNLPFLSRAMTCHRNLTVCDGLYVALAEALGAPLVTRDARLARSARRMIDVVAIG